ncbi:MAG: hypothetical protein WC243_03075, partial [Patescibacteria group bacterium]
TVPSVKVATQPPVYIKPQTSEPIKTDTCYEYEIRDGEYKSNKCYSYSDYNELSRAYSDYETVLWNIDWAESGIDITCDSDWDKFKESCDDYREQKDDFENEKDELEEKIEYLLTKGR